MTSEYDAVRHHLGVRDVRSRARIRLTGKDRASWLHGVCTQDIKALKPGQGAYATCINDVGRLMFDFTVYAGPDSLLLDMDGSLRDKALAWFDHYLITEDVCIEDVSSQYAALEIAGPDAPAVAKAFEWSDKDGVLSLASRGTGLPTWQMWTSPERFQALWDSLNAPPYGDDTWNLLRVEAGTPVYGVDMDEDQNPLEAGLNTAVSLEKGCFTGQEVIARLTFRQGPVRVFKGLKTTDSSPLTPGQELLFGGKTMARVTSSVQSPHLGRPIALGYVRRECKEPGTMLQRDGASDVEVVDLPWVTTGR